MFADLLKSMLPPGFDMDATLAQMAVTLKRANDACGLIEGQNDKLELLMQQQMALIRVINPDSRPVAAWMVTEHNTGVKRLALMDPTPTISPEEIAEKGISIDKLFF